jgi:hypothetical protein
MAKAKTPAAEAMDEIEAALRPLMKAEGWKCRARTCNRLTEDGLTQVVNFQMGRADPPGTFSIPFFREKLYGRFTVNVGVYVPEVGKCLAHLGGGTWIQESQCSIRARIGEASGKPDLWWLARAESTVIDDVRHHLERYGFPFVDRFATRDKILAQWRDRAEQISGSIAPRIVMAIILAERGETEEARAQLARQAQETQVPAHAEYVRKLAATLGLTSHDA